MWHTYAAVLIIFPDFHNTKVHDDVSVLINVLENKSIVLWFRSTPQNAYTSKGK